MKNHLKTSPIYFKDNTPSVDAGKGIIKGVTIIEEGLNKNGYFINEKFIQDTAKLGAAQKLGVKSRFGHPNLCDDALGTYLGRYKNFSVENIPNKFDDNDRNLLCVKADLYLDESAKISPKGNLFEYVLSMAENNSDMFGNSICFSSNEEEDSEVEVNGIKTYAPKIEGLLASDLVDSPAATSSLLNEDTDIAALATEFLDEHPILIKRLQDKPEIIESFLNKYINNNKMKEIEELKESQKQNFNLLTEIKSLLGFKPKELAKGTSIKDGSGGSHTIVHDEGAPCVGHSVVNEEGDASPDGDYSMGDTPVKVKGGKVAKIGDAADTDNDGMSAKLSTLEAEIAAKIEENQTIINENVELKAQLDEMKLSNENIQSQIHELKSKITGKDFVPIHAIGNEGRETPKSNLGEFSAKKMLDKSKEKITNN